MSRARPQQKRRLEVCHAEGHRTTPETIEKVISFIISGLNQTGIEEAVRDKLGVDSELVTATIDQARRKIAGAASFDKEYEIGTAILRLKDIFREAIDSQDAKTALSAQRELQRIYDIRAEQPKHADTNGNETDISEARDHLRACGIGSEDDDLVELCRLAVNRIIELESRHN